jgi:hypothetical protein
LRPARVALIALALALALDAGSLKGQRPDSGGESIHGVVRDERGQPVAFSIVQLRRTADTTALPITAVLSDSLGDWSIGPLNPGAYYVQARRIGLDQPQSIRVEVGEGRTSPVLISLRTQPLTIAPMKVLGGCLNNKTIGQIPALASLWSEARKVVAARWALYESYEFETRVHSLQETVRDGKRVVHDTIFVNDPVLMRSRSSVWTLTDPGGIRRDGKRVTLYVSAPEERNYLDPTFLARYCFEGGVDADSAGFLTVSYRPVAEPASKETMLRGMITFDTTTYAVRRIDHVFTVDGRVVGRSSISFATVPSEALPFALPVRYRIELQQPKSQTPFLVYESQKQYMNFKRKF